MENLVQDGQAFSRTAQSLGNVEKEYYTVLWQSACVQGDILRGKAAFDFLSKSQLPREILKRIWDIADWQKRGLAWEEFVVTLKLISAAQKKQLVSLERVLETSGPTSKVNNTPPIQPSPSAEVDKESKWSLLYGDADQPGDLMWLVLSCQKESCLLQMDGFYTVTIRALGQEPI
ncbi:unnamed protein product [Cladocopium goreaui]|uniref:EH domain-containing protein n=1 Tax=Cladocopium goreaui TaxID=2562237 RepID=A0A9P1G5V7_9DINO|nr:unnamed protein product [Cladocopium goreaui]